MRAVLLIACGLLTACATTSQTQRAVLCATDWTSHDGKSMPWRSWSVPAGQKPRGVVIAVHGLSGAASDFWPLGEHLATQGYSVYAYELRGQGHDPVQEERGDIESAAVWQQDLATFHKIIKRRHPRTPVYWYGESLGSLITLHTAARLRWGDPDALILATPIAGLRMAVGGFQRWLLEAVAAVSPRTRYSLGQLAGVDESSIQVTSTTTHGGQMARTPHHVSAFSLRLLTAVGGMMDASARAAARLKMPVLFLASPRDILSSADQIQRLFGQVRSGDKKLLWYTRSHHLLLHDVQRNEVVHDVATWLRGLERQHP
ncbi:MAG: alpha/beta fold hydrolase [Verrucomicrobiaceae bacterium]|nr:alpha/beta fold hydrolase [Verrucomicrobiaceae bacterium]